MNKNIAIIGGGNLGVAIAEGLLAAKFTAPQNITVTRRNLQPLQPLSKKNINISSDNNAAIKAADIIIFAVKPYQIDDLLKQVKKSISSKHTIVSVITGVSLADMHTMVGKNIPIFRAMPNTAIAIRESMTCISHLNASNEQVEFIDKLFATVGKVAIINDNLMDAATVLGSCGTAYAMRYIRANIQGGIEIGFDSKTANLIAAQTVKGAADLLLKNGTHPEQEIDKVTTPKGCTIAGLNEMEHRGFSSSLIKGISTSYHKIAKA